MNTNLITESTFALNLLDSLNFSNIKYDIEVSYEVLKSLENIQEESKHILLNSLLAIGDCLMNENHKNIKTIIDVSKTMLDSVVMIHSSNLNIEDYKLVKKYCDCTDVVEALSKKYL